MKQNTDHSVHYPTAEDLDTGHWATSSGNSLALFLIPAAESHHSVPEITTHPRIGGVGQPMPAYLRRWKHVATIPPQTVGVSVLESLQALEQTFIAESARYLGSEWDGSDLVGRWEAGSTFGDWIEDEVRDELRYYWSADDWYGNAGVDWPKLAEEAKVDPERALGDDWEDVAREVAAIIELLQDELVTGTEAYVLKVAEWWREEVQ